MLLFIRVEARVASPLVRPAMFRDPVLRAGIAMSAFGTSVVMATLVVGPFYLSGALGLDAARVGLVMSAGPVAAALVRMPAGRAVNGFGACRLTLAGLLAMASGTVGLALLPAQLGVWSFMFPLLVATGGYAAFQAANNTGVLADVRADQRGVVSGLLNLSRNLGLVTGASAMGAVLVSDSTMADASRMSVPALMAGMQRTFTVAAVLAHGNGDCAVPLRPRTMRHRRLTAAHRIGPQPSPADNPGLGHAYNNTRHEGNPVGRRVIPKKNPAARSAEDPPVHLST